MKVKKEFEYIKTYIPPRCRKPREKVVKGHVTLTVEEPSASKAPVVMAFTSYGRQVTIVRAYKGKLFWSYQLQGYREWDRENLVWLNQKIEGFSWSYHLEACPYKWVKESEDSTLQHSVIASKQEVLETMREKASHFIIVDGYVYRQESEPIYTIDSFGICDSLGLSIGQSDYVNYPEFHYSALERDKLHEDIKLRLAFYRVKYDFFSLCYIKVWDESYVKFKHSESLARKRRD